MSMTLEQFIAFREKYIESWNCNCNYIEFLRIVNDRLSVKERKKQLILTLNDLEVFFNEVMNPKEANEALKKAMLKFITR